MKKIIFIFLSTFLSLTLISCAKIDESSFCRKFIHREVRKVLQEKTTFCSSSLSETTTTSSTSNTCPAENWWQLMEGSTSRNVSLFGTPTLSRNSERTSGIDLYVDQAALSQYPKRDNYLSFDVFDADIDWGEKSPFGGHGNDQVDLSANAPVLSDNFT
ncbi:uncharacterized protein METZ01_LOCUS314663, partial [marine metagenome]